MTIEMAAQSLKRLRACLKEELANLRQLKEQACNEENFEVAATIRHLEKKYLEMEACLPPMMETM